jgi:membrane protein
MRIFFKVLKQTVTNFGSDKAPMLAAALAYYAIFALVPLLLIIIIVAGLILGEAAAQGELIGRISDFVGPSSAKFINSALANMHKSGSGFVTLISIATALFAGSGLLVNLRNTLNIIWDSRPPPAKNLRRNIWRLIETRLIAFAFIVLAILILLLSLLSSAAVSFISSHVPSFTGSALALRALELAVFFALIAVLLAFIYKYLPAANVRWGDVWLGAAVTSFLFAVGKYAIGLYLGHTSVSSTYGAAGSLVVLLLWVYYSAQILLIGAEFTHAYATTVTGNAPPDTSKGEAGKGGAAQDKPTEPRADTETSKRSLTTLLTGVALLAGLEFIRGRGEKE